MMKDPEEEVIEAEINLDSTPDDIEVEIVDDTPPGDRNRPRRPDDVPADIPDEDEIKQYSKDVQKRLNKLKWEFHEERRRKEEALRQSEEAARFAKVIYEQNQRLQSTVRGGEKVLLDQAKGRVEAELQQAKANYKTAYENGDTEGLIKAQEQIAELKLQADKVANYQPTQFEEAPVFREQPQAPQVDPLFAEWKSRNDKWFMRDQEMTNFAVGAHQKLVLSGVDPRSSEYYKKIDARMREVFPNYFSAERADGAPSRPRNAGPVVAPAVRTSGSTVGRSPRTVTLTPSQVSVARRLGLTAQQYAAQILKENGE